MNRRSVPIRWILGCAAVAVIAACGGRESGLVRFDPDPPREQGVHEVEYHASCQTGAECVVTFYRPGGGSRELFGAQWTNRFLASTGQELFVGVTVRQRCTGNYLLGNVRCDRAAGFARVSIYVDGERVASEGTFSRPRGVIPEYSFGVSTRYVIMPDSAALDSAAADTVERADTVARGGGSPRHDRIGGRDRADGAP